MAQKIMYPAAANSPGTELVEDITAAQTTITVISGSALPDAPNLFTIGSDETAETVQYTGKDGNTLTGCTRGFDGTAAKGWTAGAKVARYFAAYDHDTFIGNITDLDGRVTNAKETADAAKAAADKAETPDGAQEKADQSLKDAKAHTTTVTDNMNKDYVRFSGWGGKTGGSGDIFTLSVTAGVQVIDGFGVSFEADRDSENPSLKVNQYDPYPIVADSVNKKPVKLVAGKVYSVRKSGGYFLLDSGSADGGAADLDDFKTEIPVRRTSTINPNTVSYLQHGITSTGNSVTFPGVPTVEDAVTSIVFSGDGKIMYAAASLETGGRPYILVFDYVDGKYVFRQSFTAFGGSNKVKCRLATNADGSYVLAYQADTLSTGMQPHLYQRGLFNEGTGKYSFNSKYLPGIKTYLTESAVINNYGTITNYIITYTGTGELEHYRLNKDTFEITKCNVDVQPGSTYARSLSILGDVVVAVSPASVTPYFVNGDNLQKQTVGASISGGVVSLMDAKISLDSSYLLVTDKENNRIIIFFMADKRSISNMTPLYISFRPSQSPYYLEYGPNAERMYVTTSTSKVYSIDYKSPIVNDVYFSERVQMLAGMDRFTVSPNLRKAYGFGGALKSFYEVDVLFSISGYFQYPRPSGVAGLVHDKTGGTTNSTQNMKSKIFKI